MDLPSVLPQVHVRDDFARNNRREQLLTREENELLTRVEGNAPMGQMMRRHWAPACLTKELAEPGCAPRRVRLFGENLVAFRGLDGKVAIVGEHCPHRRASLAYAQVGQSSLMCLYHGWKMDGQGRVVEIPSEPGRSPDRIRHLSYPAREAGGIVWTYMGPQDAVPEFPLPPWMDKPGNSIVVSKIHEAANWAQSLEGTLDSVHSSVLHSSEIRSDANAQGSTDQSDTRNIGMTRPSVDLSPRIQVQHTAYGFRSAAIRRPMKNAESTEYLRISIFIAPYTTLPPPQSKWRPAQAFVPMDDCNTMLFFVAWSDKVKLDQETWDRESAAKIGVDVDSEYRKLRNRSNDYLQDREAMKRGDFTGIQGIPFQDMAMQETMGPIVDRTLENLGATDLAIVRFRQLMVHSVREFMDGRPAIGTAEPRVPLTKVRAFEALLPKGSPWREMDASPEEIASFRTLHEFEPKPA